MEGGQAVMHACDDIVVLVQLDRVGKQRIIDLTADTRSPDHGAEPAGAGGVAVLVE